MAPPAPPAEPATPPEEGTAGGAEDSAAILRRGFEEGRAAHGPLALSFDRFARRATDLATRRLRAAGLAPSPAEVAEALSRAALADLFLAAACEEGVPGAWERFTARFDRTLVALAVRRGASNPEAEEMARELPGELFTPPPAGGARTRLGTFDGAGSLQGWLAVIVQRRLSDRRRAAARLASLPEGEAGEGPGASGNPRGPADPAALAADAEMGRLFAEALREAWSALTPREALVLLFKHRDGLPQRSIARVLGVGEPRVSRMATGAAEKIRSVVLRRLGRESVPGGRDPERTLAELERAVAGFLATLPSSPDPYAHG